MPQRILRDGILTSERVNSLSDRAELFYRRLMSVVDDYGRFHANPTLLRSACYPLKIDSVKEDSIKKHLAEAAGAGLIVLYTVDGKDYLEIQDFGQRIQSKSKFPAPPLDSGSTVVHGGSPGITVENGEPRCSTAVCVVEDVVVDEGVKGARKARRAPSKTPLPDDFALSDRVRRWAEAKGFDRLDEHLEAFVAKAKARGYAYADWDSALMEAIRQDWAGLRKAPATHGQPQPRRRDLL